MMILIATCNSISQPIDIGRLPYTYRPKEEIPVLVTMFLAGSFEGMMDNLQFHYDKPDQFWNPDLSWKNKYKNHDPLQGPTFRGKYFVFTTDGWHLMKFGEHLCITTAICLKAIYSAGYRKKWYWYVFEGLTYIAANRAGFYLTYNIIKL